MKKLFLALAATLFCLVLLLFFGAFYLLGTEKGTHFLVSQAEKQLDGSLHIGSSAGKLLDRVELTDIDYDGPGGRAELGRLVLDWKSTDLLRLHLHILQFTASDVIYTSPPAAAEHEVEEPTPLSLPELKLPITITVEQLAIQNFSFLSTEDAEALTVNQANLALKWDREGINLQELNVAMDEGTLEAGGSLTPVGDYPLQLTSRLQTLDPDLPALTLLGNYEGDLQKIRIREQVSGDIEADLDVTVLEVINDPAWQGGLDIREFAPAVFSPDLPGILSGQIQTSGNLQEADATATLAMRDDNAAEYNWDAELDLSADLESMLFSVNTLKLSQVESPTRITLAGTADTDGPLNLNLQWQELKWPLTGKADYSSARGEVVLTGTVDQYHLTMDSELAGEMVPTAALKLSTDGSLERIENLDLSADLLAGSVDILGKVQWTPEITWELSSNGKEITPGEKYAEVPGQVNWLLETDGSMQDAELNGTVSLRDDTAVEYNWDAKLDLRGSIESLLLTVNELKLSHLDSPSHIELAGTAAKEGPLDLRLQWQDLQWPLGGDADYSSGQGNVTVTGTVDQYHLTLDAGVAGKMIPAASLQLATDGNLEGVENLTLTSDLLEGTASVQGNLRWAPAISWELKSNGETINPGLQYEEWPGKLNWLIRTSGSLEEDGVVADVDLDHLGGSLRELPVAGKGQVHVRPETIRIESLHLASGNAVVNAQGTLGDDSSLEWKVDIPDFSDLLPESSGELNAHGTVTGKMTSPQLALQLSASSVSLSQLELDRLQGDAELDLSWESPFHLELSGENLRSGDNLIKEVGLQGKGSMEAHSAHLLVSHQLADIELGLSGGYLEEKWQGMLEAFSIDAAELGLGTWQLREPAGIGAGPKDANLEKMCLNREKSSICLNGSWDDQNLNTGGSVQVEDFPLNWLSPWFPESLKKVDGSFSLNGDAAMAEKLQADVTAKITPGSISYITDKQKGQFPHEGMELVLHAAGDALEADLSLSVASNSIKAGFNSPDLLKKEVGSKAHLDARLQIDAENFDFLEDLVADVEDLDAAVNADFRIQGTLEQPGISGNGLITVPHVLVPAAGLDLNDTRVDITAKNQKVKVDGTFNSPHGSMALAGEAVLDKSRNWPAHFTLKGDNFRLINQPEIQVYLSSDLLLERKDGLMNLSGTATIPKADVLLRQLPAGTQTASPDVVILQEEKKEEPNSPLAMDLSVILGNKVHFAGFGLNAFIDGQISLTAKPEEQVMGSGTFHIKEGSFRAYGQDLEIQTGVVSFPGGPLSQPGINLRATRTVGRIIAGVSAIGPAAKPRITTFSNPPMSESQTISYLLTGSAPSDTASGAKLSVGRQINNKLSISVGTDVKTGEKEFIARYRLNRKVHVQTTTATSSNAADIFYTVERGDEEGKEEK